MDLDGIGAGLAALGFWSFIAAIVVAGIWYDIRKRETQHETLRRAIESGRPIDQAMMDKLLSVSGGGGERLARELMVWGLIVLFVAPGLAVLGWFVGQQYAPALLPILGASVLVGCVSIGLIVASKAVDRWYREDNTPAPGQPEA